MYSCVVGLIHNNHKIRNAYLIPLLQVLSNLVNAQLITASWQAPLKSHSYLTALYRELVYFKLAVQWANYRQASWRTIIGIVKYYFLHRLPKYFLVLTELRNWQRTSFIETAVTAKHILIWRNFVESGKDYLICCEDDVIFRENSMERVVELFESIELKLSEHWLYCDLAGGLKTSELDIARLIESQTGDKIFFNRPTTNTACSYLLSKKLAAEFICQISLKPNLSLIGIDWMMNAMFIALARDKRSCRCFHFSPPIFGHGTFTGDYISWQKS